MKSYIIKRILILIIGFFSIYIYNSLDSWLDPPSSSGGYSGAWITFHQFLNLLWIVIWCFLLLAEILYSLLKFRQFDDNGKIIYESTFKKGTDYGKNFTVMVVCTLKYILKMDILQTP